MIQDDMFSVFVVLPVTNSLEEEIEISLLALLSRQGQAW